MDTIPLSAPILMDGATGTELLKRGMPAGACTEQWVLEHPQVLLEVQRSYVAAGSRILLAPTFGANRASLERRGITGQVGEYNRRLVELTRQAAGEGVLVAGDLAPAGLALVPFGESSFEELVAVYTEQAAALEAAGVDLFVLETMTGMADARAAVLACRSVSDKPVWVTFTCDDEGRTPAGTDVLAGLIVMQGMGVAAFGLNCTNPQDTAEQLERLTPYASVPLIAKPSLLYPGGAGGSGAPVCRRRRPDLWRLLRHHRGAYCRPGTDNGPGGFYRLPPGGAGPRRDPLRQREGGPVYHPRCGCGRDH